MLKGFHDSRFNFIYDNPFGDNQTNLKNKLLEVISKNSEQFRCSNWLTDSRAAKINTINGSKIFGQMLKMNLKDNIELSKYTCDFLREVDALGQNLLTEELTSFIFTTPPIAPPQELENTNVEVTENVNTEVNNQDFSNITGQNIMTEHFDYQLDDACMEYKNTDEVTSYNLMSGKTISYIELCKLTLAIAHSQTADSMIKKDPQALFTEEQEKIKLRKELNKYMKNVDLAKNCTEDINNLSLKQLQYYLDTCKDDYENLKIFNTIKKGINLSEAGYKFAFPNGIKIPGKNKAIKLDGVASGFMELMADRTTTDGIAFKNIIEKHNWYISDETSAIISIADSLFRKIQVVDIEPPKKDEKKSSSESESDSESEL